MPFTTTTANKLLDKLLKATDFTPAAALYVSLHTGDPGNDGANEVTGGSYVRKVSTFDAAATKASAAAAALSWTGMPACTVTHVGLWSAESAGDFWWGGALTASQAVAAGNTFTIADGDFDVTLT
jgi:hypothetical protein